ncbi:hypothetical protein B566_EDAN002756 [Ephemera danica]|nr:hypothetical protein B566_EDAN002756 [Ephemera danica]
MSLYETINPLGVGRPVSGHDQLIHHLFLQNGRVINPTLRPDCDWSMSETGERIQICPSEEAISVPKFGPGRCSRLPECNYPRVREFRHCTCRLRLKVSCKEQKSIIFRYT